jgi:hypothetical protein
MFNPILSKHEIPKFNMFSKPPRGEPGVAIVLYRDHGASAALNPGKPLSMADLAWGKFAGYYRVDVGTHEFEFRINIPSKENGLNFDAKVDIVYFVSEPSIVVDKQIRDPEALLKAYATETMRSISRRHEIDRSEDAEQEISNSFRRGYNLNGISISKINVELSPDAEANTHIRGKGLDRLRFEREKNQAQLYKSLIQQGEWELLAFKLAKNPDDVDQVIESMNLQRRRDLENYLFTIKQLEDNDIVEGFQVSDQAKRLLMQMADRLGIADGKNLLSSEDPPKQLPTEKGKKRKEN